MYTLQIHVNMARNLKIADKKSSSSDPFVEIKLGKEKQKTKVISKCLNPEWNEEFDFGGKGKKLTSLKGTEDVHFHVLAKDTVFNDDLGKCMFSLKTLNESNEFKQTLWLPLTGNSKKKNGPELNITCSLVPVSASIADDISVDEEKSCTEISGKTFDSVLVRVIQAKDLLASDKNGLSDPYCQVVIGKKKRKTSVVKESLNPQWNDEFEIKLPTKKLPEEVLVKVFDKDSLIDDAIGEARFPYADLLKIDENGKTMWLKLKKESKSMFRKKVLPAGEIQIEFTSFASGEHAEVAESREVSPRLDDDHFEDKVEDQDLPDGPAFPIRMAELPSEIPNFTLIVNSAKDIRSADKNGFSDPYCTLQVGKQRHKTKTKNKTLNPEWRESFTFKSSSFKWSDMLNLIVYDADYFSSEELGTISLSLQDLFLLNGKESRHVLEGKNDEDAGEIRILVNFENEEHHEEHQETSPLNISVIKATGLRATDTFGKCDPYCVISYKTTAGKRKSVQTTIVKNTLEPEWAKNQFELEQVPQEGEITFKVMDKDLVTSDLVGKVETPLSSLTTGTHWLDLDPKGRLMVIVGNSEHQDDTMSEPNRINSGSMEEFLELLIPATAGKAKDEIVSDMISNFKLFDRSSSGTVSGMKAFNRVLESVKCKPITNKEDSTRILAAFTDDDGEINYNKFCDAVLGVSKPSKLSIPSNTVNTSSMVSKSARSNVSGETTSLVVSCSILEGRELKAADWGGKSDPYCIISYKNKAGKKKTHTTKVIKKTLNPVWENSTFDISDIDELSNISLKVMDKDLITSELIGSCEISDWRDIDQEWLDLKPKGQILMKFQISESFDEPSKVPDSPTMAGDGPQVYVKIVKAENLRAADRNGKSDPFCVIKLGRESQSTNVIKRTLEPEWNQEFLFNEKRKGIKPGTDIKILVKDKDMLFSDSLGSVTISLESLTTNSRVENWFELTGGKKAQGRIKLVATLQSSVVLKHVDEYKPEYKNQIEVHRDSPRTFVPVNQERVLSEIREIVTVAIRRNGGKLGLCEELEKLDLRMKGYLPLRRLKSGLQAYGIELNETHFSVIVPRIDPEDIDKNDYKLFCKLARASLLNDAGDAVTVAVNIDHLKTKLALCFNGAIARGMNLSTLVRAFDSCETGLMTQIDFANVLKALDCVIESRELQKIAQHIPGAFENGYINYAMMIQSICPEARHQFKQHSSNSQTEQINHNALFQRMKHAIKGISRRNSGTKYDFSKVFDSFDSTGTGKLSKRDFKRLIEIEVNGNIDQAFSDHEITGIMHALDHDKNGSVDYDEFLRLVSSSKEELEAAIDSFIQEIKNQRRHSAHPRSLLYEFSKSDSDGSGSVSRRDFRQVLCSLGQLPLNSEEMKHLMDKYDKYGTGAVNYGGFVQLVEESHISHTIPTNPASHRQLDMLMRGKHSHNESSFAVYDHHNESSDRPYQHQQNGFVRDRMSTAASMERDDNRKSMWHPATVGEWLEQYATHNERDEFNEIYHSIMDHSMTASTSKQASPRLSRSPSPRQCSQVGWTCNRCRYVNRSSSHLNDCSRCGGRRVSTSKVSLFDESSDSSEDERSLYRSSRGVDISPSRGRARHRKESRPRQYSRNSRHSSSSDTMSPRRSRPRKTMQYVDDYKDSSSDSDSGGPKMSSTFGDDFWSSTLSKFHRSSRSHHSSRSHRSSRSHHSSKSHHRSSSRHKSRKDKKRSKSKKPNKKSSHRKRSKSASRKHRSRTRHCSH